MRLLLMSMLASGVTCVATSRDTVCTSDFRYGLNVTVTDSLTGSPPNEAVLIARSGSFIDSVGPMHPALPGNGPQILVLSAAGEREGVYSVAVRSTGYLTWTRSGVVVTEDECHVRPVSLNARLQRTPSSVTRATHRLMSAQD